MDKSDYIVHVEYSMTAMALLLGAQKYGMQTDIYHQYNE